MEGGRYRRERREAMRRRRARQVRKQMAVLGGGILVFVLAVSVVGVNIYKN